MQFSILFQITCCWKHYSNWFKVFWFSPHCLYSCSGLKDLGSLLLSKFKWGHAFYEINNDILDMYAACETASDVSAAEKRHLESLQRTDAEDNLRGGIYYSSLELTRKRLVLGWRCNLRENLPGYGVSCLEGDLFIWLLANDSLTVCRGQSTNMLTREPVYLPTRPIALTLITSDVFHNWPG